ncbi:hypothetical protein CPU12_10015 [Malaciobacter molluscorum LMG 25693]|uniref:Uncharacterized protein n=1 Tax=Malaciobacter molluscorum LMG 25693 TaxID=870501 RepID=A0A2G1DG87_9BACT|nr:hypothetical protein [Malaciobacter molluscorum]AXX93489.1 hypothetical protein AMOL_2550 [Malaciobacter molluscorum LMG 25693]PHO17497.1 hypothetical protein CPU12_10015 [Malaciobacter molluscorum LMG 25693]
MQSWYISLAVVICGLIAQFAVNKYQNAEFKKQIDSLFKRADKHSEDIVQLQTQRKQYLTTNRADEVYLRRKEFELFEKHIDRRFDTLEKSISRIINHLEKGA